MQDAKTAEQMSANPDREWKRPSGPHAGLTDQQATAPQSLLSKVGADEPRNQTSDNDEHEGIQPETFSAEDVPGSTSGKAPASESADTSAKKASESKEAEVKSANPDREWKKPEGPHAGLTDQQATAPNSLLSGNDSAQPAA